MSLYPYSRIMAWQGPDVAFRLVSGLRFEVLSGVWVGVQRGSPRRRPVGAGVKGRSWGRRADRRKGGGTLEGRSWRWRAERRGGRRDVGGAELALEADGALEGALTLSAQRHPRAQQASEQGAGAGRWGEGVSGRRARRHRRPRIRLSSRAAVARQKYGLLCLGSLVQAAQCRVLSMTQAAGAC